MRVTSWRRDPLAISALLAIGFLLGAAVFRHECPTLQENAGNLERAESIDVRRSR